mgnify:FL=1
MIALENNFLLRRAFQLAGKGLFHILNEICHKVDPLIIFDNKKGIFVDDSSIKGKLLDGVEDEIQDLRLELTQ